jgi:hypothetical protein
MPIIGLPEHSLTDVIWGLTPEVDRKGCIKIPYTLLTPNYTLKGVASSLPYRISTKAVFDQIYSQESRGSQLVMKEGMSYTRCVIVAISKVKKIM